MNNQPYWEERERISLVDGICLFGVILVLVFAGYFCGRHARITEAEMQAYIQKNGTSDLVYRKEF